MWCWLERWFSLARGGSTSLEWVLTTSSSLSLPPIGVGDVITQLPAPASCCSASPTNLPPEPKVKEKKIPSSFYKLLWPWCMGTATGKQECQGVEQSGGCARARPSQPFDADSGYVMWGVVSGIRRLIHSCWKSHIQIIESGKHRVLSLHPSKTCMHWTLRLPAVSLYLNILEFNFLLVSAPTAAFLRVFSWWRSLRFHAFSRVLHLCWSQPRNWVGQLFPHPCHHHIFPSSVNSTLI